MNLRESLVRKIDTQIEKWDKEIDQLKAKSDVKLAEVKNDQAAAALKGEIANKIYAFRKKIDEAKHKADEVKSAKVEKLEKIKEDVKSWF